MEQVLQALNICSVYSKHTNKTRSISIIFIYMQLSADPSTLSQNR